MPKACPYCYTKDGIKSFFLQKYRKFGFHSIFSACSFLEAQLNNLSSCGTGRGRGRSGA